MSDSLVQIGHLPHDLVPRVLTVHGQYGGPNLWRAWWPNGYLSLKGFIADFCGHDEFDDKRALIANGRYNIVITPRIAFSSEAGFTQWRDVMREHDITWLVDSDDDLWSPEFTDRQIQVFAGMTGVKATREQHEIERLQRIYVLQRVDAVTVTTPYLAETAKRFTQRPVHVLPNLINVTAFEAGLIGSRREIPPLTVGWSGTRRQEDDLETVAAAWRLVAERYPQVQFVVQGYQSAALCQAVPPDRIFVLRGVSTAEYPAMLRNIDIACCAVSDDPWNLNKSGVKFMEASLAGSACVVSKALYGDYVTTGRTGFVAQSPVEWAEAIGMLIEDERLRRRMQRAAREEVIADHSLESKWPELVLTWSKILDERRTMSLTHATITRAKTGTATTSAASGS